MSVEKETASFVAGAVDLPIWMVVLGYIGRHALDLDIEHHTLTIESEIPAILFVEWSHLIVGYHPTSELERDHANL